MIRAMTATLFAAVLIACGGGDSLRDPVTGPTTAGSGSSAYEQPEYDPGDGNGGQGGTNLSVRVLAQMETSYVTTPQTHVARNSTEYISIYALYYTPPGPGLGMPAVGPPVVDFSKEMVVAIFLGQRPTGGYSVDVTDVVTVGDGARVEYRENQPGAGCVVTQALTSPFVMVAISKVSGEITFHGTTATYTCP